MKKLEEALALFLEAGRAGHAESQYQLGIAYWKGLGTPVNTAEAVKWLEKAATQHHKDACKKLPKLLTSLGHADEAARGVAKRKTEETALVLTVAMGMAFLNGVGVPLNTELGLKYLQQAFENGKYDVAMDIAVLYGDGAHGVKRDFGLAVHWLTRAAEKGTDHHLKEGKVGSMFK